MALKLPARSCGLRCALASCLLVYSYVCFHLLRHLLPSVDQKQRFAGVTEYECSDQAAGRFVAPCVPASADRPLMHLAADGEPPQDVHASFALHNARSAAVLVDEEVTGDALDDARNCRSVSDIGNSSRLTLRDRLERWPAGKPLGFIYLLAELQRASLLSKVLQSLNKYFNERYQYPVVIFCEDPRMEERLKDLVYSGSLPVGPAGLYYYDISKRWGPPQHILARHRNNTARLVAYSVASIRNSGCLYPTNIGYWLMCRFHSKTITELPFVKAFEYAWRLDSDAELCGPLNFDVFAWMKDRGYWQGYIGEDEWDSCAHKLTEFVQRFVKENGILPAQGRTSIDDARAFYIYNNFEIFKISFYLSTDYLKFINFIDQTGGFFYYRWGDAPVRTQASRLFMPKEKMYQFKVGEVYYRHQGLVRCSEEPTN